LKEGGKERKKKERKGRRMERAGREEKREEGGREGERMKKGKMISDSSFYNFWLLLYATQFLPLAPSLLGS
jgi:hypothetical protein